MILTDQEPLSGITLLPEGNQRITITSTGDETAAYFNSQGNISFSSFWWDQLAAGATIGDAFIYARKAIAYCSRTNDVSFSCYRPQSPLIDANSNGVPNEDGRLRVGGED